MPRGRGEPRRGRSLHGLWQRRRRDGRRKHHRSGPGQHPAAGRLPPRRTGRASGTAEQRCGGSRGRRVGCGSLGHRRGGHPAGQTASAATTAAPDDTIPLAQADPTTKFFTAFGTFRSCLKSEGQTFIGVPDASKPSSPTNDPAYIESLQTCAAKSNILQALQELQTAQNNLTPEQIEEQNKSYLAWRDCMIDRGWKIPEPKPDADGRLLSFGPNDSGPQIEGPAGEDLFDSDDFQTCASEAQADSGASNGG